MSKELLQQAVAAYKAGDRNNARSLLLQYVEIDQHNELSWLLLSNLVNDIEDRIIALENALTINPNNTRAATQLWKLKKKRYEDPDHLAADYQQRLEQAIAAKEQGQGFVAYNMLRQLVAEDDRNEQAWLLLSELAPDLGSEITALKHALLLNPSHASARMRLEQLQRYRDDPLALGKLYEEWGYHERARDIYVRVAFEAGSVVERREAERRMNDAEMRVQAPGMRLVSPQVTLARLTPGPVLLYAALVFVHGGLNPLKIAPVFWLGGFSVLAGSFLLMVASIPETRIVWHQLWKSSGADGPAPQAGLKSLGLLLWFWPHAWIVADGILRFLDTAANVVD